MGNRKQPVPCPPELIKPEPPPPPPVKVYHSKATRLINGRELSNAETAKRIRAWVARGAGVRFSWPTDGCGSEQHARFIAHKHAHWKDGDFAKFVLDYADALEAHA